MSTQTEKTTYQIKFIGYHEPAMILAIIYSIGGLLAAIPTALVSSFGGAFLFIIGTPLVVGLGTYLVGLLGMVIVNSYLTKCPIEMDLQLKTEIKTAAKMLDNANTCASCGLALTSEMAVCPNCNRAD